MDSERGGNRPSRNQFQRYSTLQVTISKSRKPARDAAKTTSHFQRRYIENRPQRPWHVSKPLSDDIHQKGCTLLDQSSKEFSFSLNFLQRELEKQRKFYNKSFNKKYHSL